MSFESGSFDASVDASDSLVTSSVASGTDAAEGCSESEARASSVGGVVESKLPAVSRSLSGFLPSSPRRRK